MSRMTDAIARDIRVGLDDLADVFIYAQQNNSVPWDARGWSSPIDLTRVSADGINAGDILVSLFCETMPITPKAGDTIRIAGKPYAVISVARDAVGAMWSIQVRG